MRENLDVRITRPLPLADLLELATRKLKEMLGVSDRLKIRTEAPTGAPFGVIPDLIPTRPKWGIYAHVEGADESLVEINVSVLDAESGESPAVISFGEYRTPLSRGLTAALAIAACELLGTEILDLEHIWCNRGQISADELQRQLSVPEPQADVQSAAAELQRRMNRKQW